MAGSLHALTTEQRALLEFLLTPAFDGRDELLAQARGVQTSGSSCDCGCASFHLNPDVARPQATVHEPVPVDANGHAPDGSPVEVLLFVREGHLSEVEVVWYGSAPPPDLPRPADLVISQWSEPTESGTRALLNPRD
jgi:hypothetical protein